jgi:hypothetical protein
MGEGVKGVVPNFWVNLRKHFVGVIKLSKLQKTPDKRTYCSLIAGR